MIYHLEYTIVQSDGTKEHMTDELESVGGCEMTDEQINLCTLDSWRAIRMDPGIYLDGFTVTSVTRKQ